MEVDDAVAMEMDQAATCRRTVTKQTQEGEEHEAMHMKSTLKCLLGLGSYVHLQSCWIVKVVSSLMVPVWRHKQ